MKEFGLQFGLVLNQSPEQSGDRAAQHLGAGTLVGEDEPLRLGVSRDMQYETDAVIRDEITDSVGDRNVEILRPLQAARQRIFVRDPDDDDARNLVQQIQESGPALAGAQYGHLRRVGWIYRAHACSPTRGRR